MIGLPAAQGALTWMARIAEWALGLRELNRIHGAIAASPPAEASRPYCDRALAALNISYRVAGGATFPIPRSGPLIVLANHPTGAADGLIVESLLRKERDDVKVLSNRLLSRIPELGNSSVFVNPFRGCRSLGLNLAPLRDALQWVEEGHALIAFPAGEVAHYRMGRGVEEPPWSEHFVRLAVRTSAEVVCAHIEGRSSAFFQLAGLVHPRIRTALLPRELLGRRGTTTRIHLTRGISGETLQRMGASHQATKYLRLRTLLPGLKDRHSKPTGDSAGSGRSHGAVSVAPPQPVEALESELNALPADRVLVCSGDFRAYAFWADEAPVVLQEIGRLREITFRPVGEGTGRAIDLDRFDSYYEHLLVYDWSARRIVGAYRIGCTAEILPRHGVAGLYTHSLFHYDRALLNQLGPSLELGRSFVTAGYQKSYAALLLLWKGIAQLVLRRPQCRRLFGVVSISDQYHSMTKQLLMAFLTANSLETRWSGMITPRTPPRIGHRKWRIDDLPSLSAVSIEMLDDLVQQIEDQQRCVPVLLRQYLGLGAKVLGFNVDPAFGNVLDAMMVVDLATVQRAVLDRFMEKDQARAFLNRHGPGMQSRRNDQQETGLTSARV